MQKAGEDLKQTLDGSKGKPRAGYSEERGTAGLIKASDKT